MAATASDKESRWGRIVVSLNAQQAWIESNRTHIREKQTHLVTDTGALIKDRRWDTGGFNGDALRWLRGVSGLITAMHRYFAKCTVGTVGSEGRRSIDTLSMFNVVYLCILAS
jgi:hypothetical protein